MKINKVINKTKITKSRLLLDHLNFLDIQY